MWLHSIIFLFLFLSFFIYFFPQFLLILRFYFFCCLHSPPLFRDERLLRIYLEKFKTLFLSLQQVGLYFESDLCFIQLGSQNTNMYVPEAAVTASHQYVVRTRSH
jgi:hypothetical protein